MNCRKRRPGLIAFLSRVSLTFWRFGVERQNASYLFCSIGMGYPSGRARTVINLARSRTRRCPPSKPRVPPSETPRHSTTGPAFPWAPAFSRAAIP